MEWGPRGENIPIEFIDMPRSGYTMNVTGPTGLPGGFTVLQDENRVPKIFLSQPFGSFPRSGTVNLPQEFNMWAVEITRDGEYTPRPEQTYTQNWNLGYNVKLLWNKTIPYPLTNGETWFRGTASYEDDLWTLYCKETRQMWGYSLTTGEMIWGPTEPEDPWNVYSRNQRVAYGNIYSYGYGGRLYCYDSQTGTLKWTYVAQGIGYESPYGDYQLSLVGIADDKIYLYSSEHSPTTPLWRGSYLRCVDAFTGEELWKSLNFVSGASIADGRIVAGNWYDQRMYCYGKGPSATTVTASPKIIDNGRSVMIEGTVTDESAGAKQLIQDGKFSIVPAIADEYMDEWMDYVYMQQNCPQMYAGVEVKLETLDPNGNYYEIGTVTSDASGIYKMMWQPPVPGEYTVIATFKGTDSYGSSWAETTFGVGEAQSPAQPIEPEPTEPAEAPLITTELAIIAAVVIVAVIGVVSFWALRKRK
jgi:hypothetical protein